VVFTQVDEIIIYRLLTKSLSAIQQRKSLSQTSIFRRGKNN